MFFNCSPTHQEVQVTLTLWLDCSLNKEDIKKIFTDVLPEEITEIDIKEEAEIYGNE